MTKFIAICSHPNAGTNINGVTFEHADGVARTAPIEEAVAAQFRGSPDFEVIEFDPEKADREEAAAKAAAEKKAADAAKRAEADAAKKAAAEAKATSGNAQAGGSGTTEQKSLV